MSKNIWMLHHYATPPSMSGLTRPYEFSKQLKGYGYKSTIFASAYLHYTNENLISDKSKYIKYIYNEIPFIFIRSPEYKNNGISRIANMISFAYGILSVSKDLLKNKTKPDVIYASSPHPLTLVTGIILGKKFNVPCVCEVRDLWPEAIFFVGKIRRKSFLGKILSEGEHWVYKKADVVVFLKEGDTDYLREKKWTLEQGGDIDLNKCFYINNGVDIDTFDKQTKYNILDDKDLNNGKFNVTYTGAIRLVNNVGNILDAAKILKHEKGIQFLIYGDGNQFEALKQRVIREQLTNVKMKGYMDKKYIPYILNKSSVNILNYSQTKYNWSRGNSSNKLFEYMASGKPIISTVKMGYCPLEKYGCGLSLEKDTPEELAKNILEIYRMPRNKYDAMGKNARHGARDFDYRMLTEKLVTVLERLDL